MSELKAFDVGLGQYCEDGSPCVVAFDADRNPRLLNEKVYLKSEADKVIADLEDKLKVQTSIAEEAWKLEDVYRTSYAEAVKELYDKNKEIAELKDKLRSLLEHDKKEFKEAK